MNETDFRPSSPSTVYYFMTPERPSLRDKVDTMDDGSRTAFVHLKYLYPECTELITGHDRLYPLQCLRTSCPVPTNCMEPLAKRVKYFFDNVVPDAGMILAYYKWRDLPESIRAGVFMRDMKEPRQIVCRRKAFERYRSEGVVYKWEPPREYWLLSGNTIPASLLIK